MPRVRKVALVFVFLVFSCAAELGSGACHAPAPCLCHPADRSCDFRRLRHQGFRLATRCFTRTVRLCSCWSTQFCMSPIYGLEFIRHFCSSIFRRCAPTSRTRQLASSTPGLESKDFENQELGIFPVLMRELLHTSEKWNLYAQTGCERLLATVAKACLGSPLLQHGCCMNMFNQTSFLDRNDLFLSHMDPFVGSNA